MPLNIDNIELLKADLLAQPRRYNQSRWGDTDPACGTVQCLGGFCLLREIGEQGFRDWISGRYTDPLGLGLWAAVQAGIRFLGIETDSDYENDPAALLPQIFRAAAFWPKDLRQHYLGAWRSGEGAMHEVRAQVACDALDRLLLDGSIRELDPEPAAPPAALTPTNGSSNWDLFSSL